MIQVLVALLQAGWRRHRTLAVSLALALYAFELLIAAVYGTTVGNVIARLFSGALTVRAGVRGVVGGSADLFSPEGWLGFGYIHPLALVIVIVWTVAVAGAAVSAEVESGTAEFLVSHPVDRRLVLFSRFLVWGGGLGVVLSAGYLGTVTGTFLVAGLGSIDRTAGMLLPAALVPMLFGIAGVAFLCSATSSTRAHANAGAISFAVVSYLLNLGAVLWAPMTPLAPLSVFHYLTPADWVHDGGPLCKDAVPVVLGVVTLLVALRVFDRRDVAP